MFPRNLSQVFILLWLNIQMLTLNSSLRSRNVPPHWDDTWWYALQTSMAYYYLVCDGKEQHFNSADQLCWWWWQKRDTEWGTCAVVEIRSFHGWRRECEEVKTLLFSVIESCCAAVVEVNNCKHQHHLHRRRRAVQRGILEMKQKMKK